MRGRFFGDLFALLVLPVAALVLAVILTVLLTSVPRM
jgi:hypothetical protein